MNIELLVLVQIQDIDSQLQRLESTKGDLPQRLRETKGRHERLTAEKKGLRHELDETNRKRMRAEGDFDLLKQRKAKYQKQLFTVRNNREYDAVTAEIEAAEKGLEDLETQVITFLEAEEQLKNQLERVQADLLQTGGELKKVEQELAAKSAQVEARIEDLEQRRAKVVAQIRKPLLDSYERVRRAKDGLAVVPVSRGACGGCFSQIPPQRALEIRASERIYSCEVCGRFLYWKDDTFSGSR